MRNALLLLLSMSVCSTLAHAGLSPLRTLVIDGRSLVVDPSSLTVYVYDRDSAGVSDCYDGCARAWPPVLVPAGAQLQAPLSLVVRKDGAHQVAYAGRPLYLYAGDAAPGQANGDGLGGVWHVVPASN